jgi:hypothetical protein
VRVHCVWRTGPGANLGVSWPPASAARDLRARPLRVADGLWDGLWGSGALGPWGNACGGRAGDGLADQGWKLVDLAAQAAEPNE